jgi:hypothetical protein
MVKRTLPDDLQSFESAAALADELAAAERKQAAEIAEIARRLQAVRTQLELVSPRKLELSSLARRNCPSRCRCIFRHLVPC